MMSVSSKYLSRNSSTEARCMTDCAMLQSCSTLCRKRCVHRVCARNKGITLFSAPFHFYRPLDEIESALRVIRKLKQA